MTVMSGLKSAWLCTPSTPVIFLISGHRQAHIKPEQAARFVEDPWQETIAKFIAGKDRVTVGMVATDALFFEAARTGTHDALRIRGVLMSLGWVKRVSNGVGWYVRSAVSE